MRVMGVNVLGVVAAGLAFWIIGALWYPVIFQSVWMDATGWTEADFEGSSPAWMGLGVIISLVTAAGLAVALSWGGLPDMMGALKRTLILWAAFGVTAALYTLAYSPQHSMALFLVDSGYYLVGWLVAAAIIATLR